MPTTRGDIRGWLERGKNNGASHLIVVCDTYDYDDYPVYVMPGQDPYVLVHGYNAKPTQRVMEIYRINLDWEKQLAEHRSFNY